MRVSRKKGEKGNIIMRYFYKQVYIHAHIFQQRIFKKKEQKKNRIYTYNTDYKIKYIYIYIILVRKKRRDERYAR